MDDPATCISSPLLMVDAGSSAKASLSALRMEFYKRLPHHWPKLSFLCTVNEEMGYFGGIILAAGATEEIGQAAQPSLINATTHGALGSRVPCPAAIRRLLVLAAPRVHGCCHRIRALAACGLLSACVSGTLLAFTTRQSTAMPLQPIAPGERIADLDVIRDFALFGVLVAYIVWSSRSRCW